MRKRLKVTPVEGEIGRFHVDSQRKGESPYLVDLMAMDCAGICGCQHYEHRLYKIVKLQMLVKNRMDRILVECIHIRDARDYFLQEILFKLKDKEPKPHTAEE